MLPMYIKCKHTGASVNEGAHYTVLIGLFCLEKMTPAFNETQLKYSISKWL